MKRLALIALCLASLYTAPASAYFYPGGYGSLLECSDQRNARGAGKHTLDCSFRPNTIQMTAKGVEYEATLFLGSSTTVRIERVGYRGWFAPQSAAQPCDRSNIQCIDITNSFYVGGNGSGSTTGFGNITWQGWDYAWFTLAFQTHGSGSISPTRYNDWYQLKLTFDYIDL